MEKNNSFHGRNYYKVDTKGRVPFPAQWFAPLDLRYGESLVIARGFSPDSKYLELYSPASWKEKIDALDKSIPEGKLKNNFMRWFVSTAESVELDTQNRIRLSKYHMEYAGIQKEVVLLGCVDRIEIWAKELLDDEEEINPDDFNAVFGYLNDFKNSDRGE